MGEGGREGKEGGGGGHFHVHSRLSFLPFMRPDGEWGIQYGASMSSTTTDLLCEGLRWNEETSRKKVCIILVYLTETPHVICLFTPSLSEMCEQEI